MKKTSGVIAAVAVMAVVAAGVAVQRSRAAAAPAKDVEAILVKSPLARPPADREGPARVIVSLETTEQKGTLASGVEYTFWTFGGIVPGPMIRVRVGDTVEIRLSNTKGSHNAHSIDLHAVTGPGGGAAVTQIGPGERGAIAA
jgi:nitrite reductase (NO-forming)